MVLVRFAINGPQSFWRATIRQHLSTAPTAASLNLSKSCSWTPLPYPSTRALGASIDWRFFPFHRPPVFTGLTQVSAPVTWTSTFSSRCPSYLVSSPASIKSKADFLRIDRQFFSSFWARSGRKKGTHPFINFGRERKTKPQRQDKRDTRRDKKQYKKNKRPYKKKKKSQKDE